VVSKKLLKNKKKTKINTRLLPGSCFDISAVGLVYIVGGLNEMNAELQSVDVYNPVTERWTQASDMQSKRAYVGVSAVNGFIYAVGGWTEKDGALATVERYSITEVQLLLYINTLCNILLRCHVKMCCLHAFKSSPDDMCNNLAHFGGVLVALVIVVD